MYFFKSSGNILYTCSNIKRCKSIRSKQTVKKPGHFNKCEKPAWMKIFGSRRRHAWGKEDVESYNTTTTNVAPAPTTNTTTVAAQVDPVYCLITIQYEGKIFFDTMMCHLAKGL